MVCMKRFVLIAAASVGPEHSVMNETGFALALHRLVRGHPTLYFRSSMTSVEASFELLQKHDHDLYERHTFAPPELYLSLIQLSTTWLFVSLNWSCHFMSYPSKRVSKSLPLPLLPPPLPTLLFPS